MTRPHPPDRPPAHGPRNVTAAQALELEVQARLAGHCIVHLDLAACRDKTSLLAEAAVAFRFPDWFGHNWDALSDSLGDLSWLDATGYLVELRHPENLRAAAPEIWRTLCAILDEVADERRRQGISWTSVQIVPES